MSVKSCVYRNCQNYVNVIDKTYSKENLTFFQFPKNPERRQKWIELGKAPPNLPAHYYYYCSDHFDKRFLCIGPRRTMLVGEALPYEYVNEQEEEPQFLNADTEELYYIKDDSVIPVEDQDLQVESTTAQDNDIIQFLNIDEYAASERFVIKDTIDSKSDVNILKRSREHITTNPTSTNSKLKIMKCTSLSTQRPLSKPQTSFTKAVSVKADSAGPPAVSITKTERCVKKVSSESPKDRCSSRLSDNVLDASSLIDNNHVTTFIFKGEEYVQMPKEFYINEKKEMVNKLQKMEKVIATIKEQLINI